MLMKRHYVQLKGKRHPKIHYGKKSLNQGTKHMFKLQFNFQTLELDIISNHILSCFIQFDIEYNTH